MAGFMAGFGTTMAKLIENDREYFRDRAAKRQEYLQTYGTRAVTDRQDKAAQSLSVVNSLITAGVPKEDVRYVLDKSGIQGLAQLKATIDSRTDLTAEERTTLVKKASDYVADNKGEDFETVINRAWGLYKSSDNPVQRERNIFSAMLGLDANMMEEDVLDDLYVNGYSGRDIYRIMGTSGPKPGEALDLNLPAKRPNSQMLNFTSTALMDQFESSVDAKILATKAEYAKLDKNDPNAKNYLDTISSLEALKGQGFNGIGTYARTYDPSLFTFAQTLESQTPGVVTRHPLLAPFLVDYTDYFSEADDEAKMAAGAGTTATAAPTVIVSPPAGNGITLQTGNAVMEFETTAEFNTAAAAGNIPAGASIQIGGGAVQTFNPPKAAAAPKTTDLGDMTGAPGFRDEFEPKPELTVEQRVQAKRDAAQNVIDSVDSNVSSFTQTLDKGFASGLMTTNAHANTFLGGVAQLVGADDAADFFYEQSVKSEDGAESTEGLVPAINSVLDGLGVPDYSKEDKPLVDLQSAVDAVMDAIPAIPQNLEIPKRSEWTPNSWPSKNGRKVTDDNVLFDMLVYDKQNKTYPDSDYLDDGFTQEQLDRVRKEVDAAFRGSDLDAAFDRAPKHIEKLGSQATDAWRKLTAEVKDFSFSDISLSTPDEDNPMLGLVQGMIAEEATEEKPANVATRASDTPAYKQLQELLQERIALANRPPKARKKKEETIKKKAEKILIDLGDMSGAPGFRTEEVSLLSLILADELPERIVEYNPRAIGTVGSRDLGLRDTTDDVRDRQNQPADLQMSAARGASPTEDSRFFDSTKNMAVENLTTRGRFQTPSGLMSRPSPESPPQLGSAEFTQMIKRVHGSSKAAKAFGDKVSSGKLTAADVSRMIKATDKLPNTKTKDQLLLSLYDLRDSLNNR